MRLLTMATADPRGFEALCGVLDEEFLKHPVDARGEWQSIINIPPHMATREINHVVLELPILRSMSEAQSMVRPNLPWAEDHFQERVGGKPVNPPPSAAWWPHRVQGHKDHVNLEGKFSHTYPERMWPKHAGDNLDEMGYNVGLRYDYGDLNDLITVLKRNSWSRQAYLPIWFPEDLEAARTQRRVPCTIGYHFLRTHHGVDCTYYIRSCDYIRHFRDDVYMAMRLTQWVCEEVGGLKPGYLFMHISNFHTFAGDDELLVSRLTNASLEIQGGNDGC